jgi:hypothetical protein
VSSPHKNIYREQFVDFGLNKNENDNFLMANNGKIQINICVADFCSYCFYNKFHFNLAAYPCMLLFVIAAQRKAPRPTEFPFFL